MNLARNPDLLDRMASQYALGVLRGGARRRMEQLARQEPAVHAAIAHWQRRLAGVAELHAPAVPIEAVWCGIERRLGWKAEDASGHASANAPHDAEAPPAWWHRWHGLAFWRASALMFATVAVVVVVGSLVRWQATPPSPGVVVAVLQSQHSQPAMLVSWDAQGRALVVRRLDDLPLTPQQALQLWALPHGGKPISLGVLGHARQARLPLDALPANVDALAVSVEPPGGSPQRDAPSGPVVFQGALLKAPA
ncbi:anti-sigma factor domain-containing protein [Cupriavidus sp. D384]|uniref:anti-sigma factor n=1 Tax=Cupriavidus sp. D384 TaxID=1538095 RepID=UPI00083565A3|nr:anti-sigma factor [Cupriavidus sp. D384]